MVNANRFEEWSQVSLAKFSHEVYEQLKLEQAANEQLRQDFKDAMQLLRESSKQ